MIQRTWKDCDTSRALVEDFMKINLPQMWMVNENGDGPGTH